MMTRTEMNAYVLAAPDADLQSEIQHYMDIEDREYDYDPVCALLDIEEAHQQVLADGIAEPYRRQYRRTLAAARRVLIGIGFYRIMTQDEIDSTVRSDNRVPWAFKLDGAPYHTEETASEWMDGAQP